MIIIFINLKLNLKKKHGNKRQISTILYIINSKANSKTKAKQYKNKHNKLAI